MNFVKTHEKLCAEIGLTVDAQFCEEMSKLIRQNNAEFRPILPHLDDLAPDPDAYPHLANKHKLVEQICLLKTLVHMVDKVYSDVIALNKELELTDLSQKC